MYKGFFITAPTPTSHLRLFLLTPPPGNVVTRCLCTQSCSGALWRSTGQYRPQTPRTSCPVEDTGHTHEQRPCLKNGRSVLGGRQDTARGKDASRQLQRHPQKQRQGRLCRLPSKASTCPKTQLASGCHFSICSSVLP